MPRGDTDAQDKHSVALDLGELLLYWDQRERSAFGGSISGDWMDVSLQQEIRRIHSSAYSLLRMLMPSYGELSDLPAAVTLFDLLLHKALSTTGPKWKALEILASPAMLTSVAIVTLKLGSVSTQSDELSIMQVYESLLVTGFETVETAMIKCAEAAIFADLKGCVGLTAAPQLAHVVIERLATLRAVSRDYPLDVQPILSQLLLGVGNWAMLLLERVPATSRLPPRALALGACALGLTTTGIMEPGEVRPLGLPDISWEASLLVQLRGNMPYFPQTNVQVDAIQVAEAACCEMEEFRTLAYAAVNALQASMEERYLQDNATIAEIVVSTGHQ